MNRKDGAFSECAVDLEQTPVMIDDMLHDGEAETGAAKLPRAGGIDPVEALGEPRDVLGENALAVVADRDLRRGRPREALQWGAGADLDGGPGAPVFDRVIDQVLEHLGELVGIA